MSVTLERSRLPTKSQHSHTNAASKYRLGESKVVGGRGAVDRVTVVVVEQRAQRVPAVTVADANAVQRTGRLPLQALRKYVVVANLLVVPDRRNQTLLAV